MTARVELLIYWRVSVANGRIDPLVNGNKKRWKDPPLKNGKTHELYMAMFNSYFDITRG